MHTLRLNNRELKWSTPAQQDVDPAALAIAFDEGARYAPLQSLHITRHGFLIGEYYADGIPEDRVINVHSISKSILSLLTGVALRERWLTNLDQPIADWFPEYFDAQTDARKRSITIRHLLTMSAGLGWIENEPGIHHWQRSADWSRYAIELPIVALPGRQFNYNTALTHLLSTILARASGLNTRLFAERYLFEPAGIDLVDWAVDPHGNAIGGTDVYLRPRDLLKIGQLLLNRGTLNQQEIVSPGWLAESTQSHIALSQPGFWHPAYKDYGYLWWLRKMQSFDTVVASGYAGQLLFVVRRLGLVVVATADDSIPFSAVMKQSNHIEGLVEDFIIPAVQEDTRHGFIERGIQE